MNKFDEIFSDDNFAKLNESVQRSPAQKEETMNKIRIQDTKSIVLSKPLLAVIACIVLLGVICLSTIGYKGINEQLTADVSNYVGKEIIIPNHQELDINFVGVRELNRTRVEISYAKELGEAFFNIDQKEAWEDENNGKIFLGPYSSDPVINLSITFGTMEFHEKQSRTIENTDVYFELLERPDGTILETSFIYEDAIYELMYYLDEKYTEAEAFEFTEQIIKSLNE
ncbi:hypothetical protein [Sutcliffiella sp. NC1]|uniref:hypothetical protein n=1 Tax=Sutcliffiella sp. NC1 TaxID=3004096 RepID=UPI0022DE542D|nr:hypothetical protein [Sutcliffiella sp. NC1]WBL16900.1 hypothetical protein O1A01_09810 [Sutcliffiella sp. NC1]